MYKTPLDYFAIIMTISGTALSVIGTFVTLNLWDKNIGTAILIILLLFLSLLLIWFLNRWVFYKRYYEAYPIINSAFAQANSIVNPVIEDSATLKEDVSTLQRFCTEIARAYSLLTGSQCAVCIKILVGDENNERFWVDTFVRDYNSSLTRTPINHERKKHYLELNTDFSYIFDPALNQELIHKFYRCNDFANEPHYRNTRLPRWWFEPDDVSTYADRDFPAPRTTPMLSALRKLPVLKSFVNRAYWPLPYQSGIVVPIVPLNTADLQDPRTPLQGYLCIDSDTHNVFDNQMLIDIAMGIADGLDPAMRTISRHYSNGEKDTGT